LLFMERPSENSESLLILSRPIKRSHLVFQNKGVTLVGMVANQGDKNLIGIRASGVPDVFHVTNS
jgi:hypothetical protein